MFQIFYKNCLSIYWTLHCGSDKSFWYILYKNCMGSMYWNWLL